MTKTAAEKKTLTALRDSYTKYVISKNKIELTPEINVDDVLEKKLPGVPDNAVILEIGLGELFEQKWKTKYKL
jgi:phosphomannomutase